MLYDVREITGAGCKGPVLFKAVSVDAAALSLAQQIGKPHISFEPDAGYPGCADIFSGDGRLFVIEPEGFELHKLPVEG